MPKAKRAVEISLTKTKKKTKENKGNLIQRVRDSLNEYERLYVIEYENVPSSEFIKVRQEFKADSQFLLGKKSVMSVALGRTKEEEVAEDLHAVSQCLLSGEKRGLLFTNKKHASVLKNQEQFKVKLVGYWTSKKGYHEI